MYFRLKIVIFRPAMLGNTRGYIIFGIPEALPESDVYFFLLHWTVISFTHTVDGSEILHQLRLVGYPIVFRVSYIPGGCLGFQPSTVSQASLKPEA